MDTAQPWTIRQYAGFSTAKIQRFIANRQPGKKVSSCYGSAKFTEATTPITPRVAGDVGKAGVAIDIAEDMKVLFDQIRFGCATRLPTLTLMRQYYQYWQFCSQPAA